MTDVELDERIDDILTMGHTRAKSEIKKLTREARLDELLHVGVVKVGGTSGLGIYRIGCSAGGTDQMIEERRLQLAKSD